MIRERLGKTEEDDILVDRVEETWETYGMLVQRFGLTFAHRTFLAKGEHLSNQEE